MTTVSALTGLWTLGQLPTYRPTNRLMPPTSFDSSAVDRSVNFRLNSEYGFHPVELGGDWTGRLALKLCAPLTSEERRLNLRNLTRGQWFGWCDARKIGAPYYGTYELADESRFGFLVERLRAHVPITEGCAEPEKIRAYWNDRSRADWARIKGVFLAGGVTPTDLQIVLEETGRLFVVDPELFELSPSNESSFANHLIVGIEAALSKSLGCLLRRDG